MNWFKENKFAGILLIITALLVSGAVAMGFVFGSKSNAARQEFEATKRSMSKHKKIKPYPIQANLEQRKEEGLSFKGEIEALQSALVAYRPTDLSSVPVNVFTDRLKSIDTDLRVLFADAGVALPEDFYVGFEKYSSAIPRQDATGILNYELSAVEWLLNQVATAQVSSIVSVKREVLPIESGRSASKPSAAAKAEVLAQQELIEPIEERLGIDLVVKGKESSIRRLLNLISSSEDYFFLMNALSIKNERGSGPNLEDVSFESKDEEDENGGEQFFFEEEGEAEKASSVADSVEILKPVLGSEEVYLALNMDLILFAQPEALPEIK